MAINFYETRPVYRKMPDGSTSMKIHGSGSCDNADIPNLPLDMAGGSDVLILDAGENDEPVLFFDEDKNAWGGLA